MLEQEHGYLVFNNGIIIQYGVTARVNNGTVIFPISFSSTKYSLTLTEIASGSTTWAFTAYNVSSRTATQFVWSRYDLCINHWIGIGF